MQVPLLSANITLFRCQLSCELAQSAKICRGQPPDYILRKAKNTSKFFKFVGSINHDDRDQNHRSNCSMYQVLTEEEYAAVSTFSNLSVTAWRFLTVRTLCFFNMYGLCLAYVYSMCNDLYAYMYFLCIMISMHNMFKYLFIKVQLSDSFHVNFSFVSLLLIS